MRRTVALSLRRHGAKAVSASPLFPRQVSRRDSAMASLSFQGNGGAKKEEKGKNIQVVVRCR